MEKVMIKDVLTQEYNGKPKWVIPYDKYQLGGEASTFNKEIADALISAKGKEVELEIVPNDKNNKYAYIKAMAGIDTKKAFSGGGGRPKYTPEDIARMEKRDEVTRLSIEKQSILDKAVSIVVAEIGKGLTSEEPAKQALFYADQFIEWFYKGANNGNTIAY